MKISTTGKERNRGSNTVVDSEIRMKKIPSWDPSWDNVSKSWRFTLEGYSHMYRFDISAKEVLCLLDRAMLANAKLTSHERAQVQSVMAYTKEILLAPPSLDSF